MFFEVVRANALRLLPGLHQGPRQAQLHTCWRWKAGLQNPVVWVQRYNCSMSNRKAPLATTAFYFISFACLYGNIILTRLHRLRIAGPLTRLHCKKVRIAGESWVCLVTRSKEIWTEFLSSSSPLKKPANRKMPKIAQHLAIRDRWLEEPVSC